MVQSRNRDMPHIRGTDRLLKLLGEEAIQAAETDDSEDFDQDWYADLFWVERRKCLIFVNAGTLFPVVALDVLKDDFRDPGSLLRDCYRQVLRHLRAPDDEIETELAGLVDLPVGKTRKRRMLGALNDLANGAKWIIEQEGGLAASQDERVSAMLAGTPMRGIERSYPLDQLQMRVPGLRPELQLPEEPPPLPGPPDVLADFLNRPGRRGEVYTYHEILGYMFFMAASPVRVPSRDWILFLLGGEYGDFKDGDEARAVVGEMDNEYNRVVQDVESGLGFDMDYLRFSKNPLDNFANSSPVHQWARGFAIAHMDVPRAWLDIPMKDMRLVRGALGVLSFFSSREMAVSYLEQTGRTMAQVRQAAADMCEKFAISTELLAVCGRVYREAPKPRRSSRTGSGAVGRAPKVGRNQPCPCGSGRKYKRCCGSSGVARG